MGGGARVKGQTFPRTPRGGVTAVTVSSLRCIARVVKEIVFVQNWLLWLRLTGKAVELRSTGQPGAAVPTCVYPLLWAMLSIQAVEPQAEISPASL